VDHRVKTARRIRRLGHLAHARHGLEIPDYHASGSWGRSKRIGGTRVVAGMENNLMTVAYQQLRGQEAEPVGRTGDKYSGH
jgi:hypothetical protein